MISDMIVELTAYVKEHMAKYDQSHDYAHVLRVVNNAKQIANSEQFCNKVDLNVINAAALMHDVNDIKYIPLGEYDENKIYTQMKIFGASDADARKINNIVNHTSYQKERDLVLTYTNNAWCKKPETSKIKEYNTLVNSIPELQIVQDADRLDALGAVGIARIYIHQTIKQNPDINKYIIKHFKEKCVTIPLLMKTEYGREMAKIRLSEICIFIQQLEEQL